VRLDGRREAFSAGDVFFARPVLTMANDELVFLPLRASAR
jgi:hypothetical protein